MLGLLRWHCVNPRGMGVVAGVLLVAFGGCCLLYVLALCRRRSRATTSSARESSRFSSLLASREFVRDMARLAEHIVMYDVVFNMFSFDPASTTAAELKMRLRSRESAAFPDKVGDEAEKSKAEASSCYVRGQRARWLIAFKQRYDPIVADWIDTAVQTEKQAAVLLLRPPDEPPLVVVAFRGSKALQDYVRTDINPSFVPVPLGSLAIHEAMHVASKTARGEVDPVHEATPLRAARRDFKVWVLQSPPTPSLPPSLTSALLRAPLIASQRGRAVVPTPSSAMRDSCPS